QRHINNVSVRRNPLNINQAKTQKPMNTQNITKTESGHITSCPDLPNPSAQPGTVPQKENFPPNEKNLQISENHAPTPEDLRIRAGSFLARLNADQRSQLFKWLLEYTVADVLNLVAAPAPGGFGIQTHKTTLHRIKAMIGSHASSVAFEN